MKCEGDPQRQWASGHRRGASFNATPGLGGCLIQRPGEGSVLKTPKSLSRHWGSLTFLVISYPDSHMTDHAQDLLRSTDECD